MKTTTTDLQRSVMAKTLLQFGAMEALVVTAGLLANQDLPGAGPLFYMLAATAVVAFPGLYFRNMAKRQKRDCIATGHVFFELTGGTKCCKHCPATQDAPSR